MREYPNEVAKSFYYKPSEWETEGRLWPIRSGMTYPKWNYNVGPKQIECYSLHFVRKGSVQFDYEDQQVVLTSGDIFCLYPARIYAYRIVEDDEPLEMNWLAIDGPEVALILESSGFRVDRPYIKDSWSTDLKEMLNRVMDLMKPNVHSGMDVWLEMQSLLYGIFSNMVDVKQPSDLRQRDWLQQSIDYIKLHATNGISVQEVAEIIGIHRAYFSSEFKRKIGISPIAYITKQKMDRANLLLLETNNSITEIAYSLGYPNVFSFTRAFKSNFSICPSEFRKRTICDKI
ncbi:AraC family transcriptional regulator [Paenibacillus sp. CMAA1364]